MQLVLTLNSCSKVCAHVNKRCETFCHHSFMAFTHQRGDSALSYIYYSSLSTFAQSGFSLTGSEVWMVKRHHNGSLVIFSVTVL